MFPRFQIHVTNELLRIVKEVIKPFHSMPLPLDRDSLASPANLYSSIEKSNPSVINFVPQANHASNGINISNAPNQQHPITMTNGIGSSVCKKADSSFESQFGRLSIISNESNYSTGSYTSSIESMSREFADNVPIEEFVSELASFYNRGIEKASEWLRILKGEDIDSVGDLRRLQEEDWSKLNLTVFAGRAMKNAIKIRTVTNNNILLASLSPKVTGRTSDECN